jgi:plasmid replication initiation protein
MSLSNRNIVKQSYELNNARYSLTAVETDIIMRMIAEVRNEDEDFKPYRFKVSELEKKMGKQLNRGNLKTIALELRRKNLTIDKGTDGFLVTGWVSSFEYFAKTGEMELCFDPKLKPYLLKLQGHFAMSDIRQIFQLSSEYAKRIYTIFKQWEKVGNYTIEVSEWQKILEVPKSLLVYADFKRKVLEVAKDQINKNTDLSVDYKEIKTGRKITHLEWAIKKKSGTQTTLGDFSSAEIDTEEAHKIAVFSVRLGRELSHSVDSSPLAELRKETKKYCQYHGVEYSKNLFDSALKIAKDIISQTMP